MSSVISLCNNNNSALFISTIYKGLIHVPYILKYHKRCISAVFCESSALNYRIEPIEIDYSYNVLVTCQEGYTFDDGSMIRTTECLKQLNENLCTEEHQGDIVYFIYLIV